jgi:hypothetical protein
MYSPKTSNEFFVNQLVFAKVKGHPYWPAKVKKVDKMSSKNATMYEVDFFGTNETATLGRNNLCAFNDNKSKFTVESVALKRREVYKLALTQINEAWADQCKNNHSPSVGSNRTPNKLANDNLIPPPIIVIDPVTPVTDCEENTKTVDNRPTTALNKMSLEDKVEDSHSSALPEDYHKQILKQELFKFKSEINNLRCIIETLESDKKLLLDEITQLKLQNQPCTNCFPPLRPNNNTVLKPCEWQKDKRPIPGGMLPSLPPDIQCSNRFDVLRHNDDCSKKGEPPVIKPKDLLNPAKSQDKPLRRRFRRPINGTSQHKLLILADSHGRHIGSLVQQKTTAKVCTYVKPGARFDQVIKEAKVLSSELNKNDHLLVIAGTNNIETTSIHRLTDGIGKLLRDSLHTNLVLATIPMRHDSPNLDLKISQVNAEIENLAKQNPNLKLLPLHMLPRHLYTIHGVHFNRRGKIRIAEMVTSLLHRSPALTTTTNKNNNNKEVSQPTNSVPNKDNPGAADSGKNCPSLHLSTNETKEVTIPVPTNLMSDKDGKCHSSEGGKSQSGVCGDKSLSGAGCGKCQSGACAEVSLSGVSDVNGKLGTSDVNSNAKGKSIVNTSLKSNSLECIRPNNDIVHSNDINFLVKSQEPLGLV